MGKDIHEESKRKRTTASKRKYGQGAQVADWTAAEPEKLRLAVERVTLAGGRISFGYTRDGGAFSVGILGDGDPYMLYCPGTSDLNEFLQTIIDAWE